MGARDTLQRAAARTGWDTDSVLDVICRYVDDQGADDAFADFVEEAADEECGAPDDGPGLFDGPGAGAGPPPADGGPGRTWDVWPATRFEVVRGGGDHDTYWDPTRDAGEAEGWVVLTPDGGVHVASEHGAFGTPEAALARAARLARRGGGRARAWGTFEPDEDAAGGAGGEG